MPLHLQPHKNLIIQTNLAKFFKIKFRKKENEFRKKN